MGLHVGAVGTEQFFCTVDGKLFGNVDVLAASVVAATGVALGVLVGKHRSRGLEHRGAGVVFRSDHHQLFTLALFFIFDDSLDFRIDSGNCRHGFSDSTPFCLFTGAGALCCFASSSGFQFRGPGVFPAFCE